MHQDTIGKCRLLAKTKPHIRIVPQGCKACEPSRIGMSALLIGRGMKNVSVVGTLLVMYFTVSDSGLTVSIYYLSSKICEFGQTDDTGASHPAVLEIF